MSDEINAQFGFERTFGKTNGNADAATKITKFGISFNKTTVQANSKEELLDKIKNVDWDSIKSEENKIGGRFDFSV